MTALLMLLACKLTSDGIFGSDTGSGIFGGDRGDDSGGGGGDSDPDGVPECRDDYSTAAPEGPECLSGVLSCGDVLEATTEGGTELMESDTYQDAYCFVPFEDYDGAERGYELIVPPDTLVEITADFKCEDMAIAAFAWSDEDRCPYEGAGIYICEGKEVSSGGTITVLPDTVSTRYVVVVDSPSGNEAPFSLKVVCESR